MKLDNFSIAIFAALSLVSLSTQAQVLQPETYRYGSNLDIKKILFSKEGTTPACGVVTSRLTYLDSMDHVHDPDYRGFSGGC